jgi:transposase
MKREGRAPILRKSRWLLLRRSENLVADQHFRLCDLLRYNLKTVRAYLLKEAFQQLWETTRPGGPVSSSTSGAARRWVPASNP